MKGHNTLRSSCTGVVLAGGSNTRIGKNKALLTIGDKRILDYIYQTMKPFFDEILLVTNDPMCYLDWDLKIVTDIFHLDGSLIGIHAGLFHAHTTHAFITACDTPFLKKELINLLLEQLESHLDVILPVTEEGNQPLCAIYSRRCLKAIEEQIRRRDLKIDRFFSEVRTKKVTEKMLRKKDHELISFFNINTLKDLEDARRMV